MKIKLSQSTPRKPEGTIITPKVRIHTLEETYLLSDVTHVMRKDTYPDIVLKTKVDLTRRRETRRDIMLTLQKMMNLPRREPNKKVMTLPSDEEYVLISALTGTVSHGSNDWFIDSGASKHMTGFKESFMKLSKHESPHKVKLGDDYQYPIKGSGESSYKLDS